MSTARMQSYIDTDYVAVLAAGETQISTITLAVRRSQTNDVTRGAVSGVSRPSTQFGTSTVTFSSSMDLYNGGLFLINDTSYGPPTCPYSINASLSGVFDFSSNGWLAHPNTTVTTLPSGLLLFVLVCDSVYNQTTGNYTNTNVGWCYDMSINTGYVSSALALGEWYSHGADCRSDCFDAGGVGGGGLDVQIIVCVSKLHTSGQSAIYRRRQAVFDWHALHQQHQSAQDRAVSSARQLDALQTTQQHELGLIGRRSGMALQLSREIAADFKIHACGGRPLVAVRAVQSGSVFSDRLSFGSSALGAS
jgi:hypothetical protein